MACFTLSTTSLSDDGSVASIVATKMASRRWNGNLPRRQPLCSKRRPKISWLASLPTNSKPKKNTGNWRAEFLGGMQEKVIVLLQKTWMVNCNMMNPKRNVCAHCSNEQQLITQYCDLLRVIKDNQKTGNTQHSAANHVALHTALRWDWWSTISMETSAKETFSISVLWNEWFSNFRQQTQQFVESWVNVLQGESKMYQVEPSGWYP